MNKVFLIGRLTVDPVLKYTSSNVAVASFSLAVDRKFKNENGDYEADFINVVAWKNKAELIHGYVQKGDLISVVGRLQVRAYQNDRGENRRTTEVILEEIEFLKSKPKEEESIQNANVNSSKNSDEPFRQFANEHQEDFKFKDEEGYDLPF